MVDISKKNVEEEWEFEVRDDDDDTEDDDEEWEDDDEEGLDFFN